MITRATHARVAVAGIVVGISLLGSPAPAAHADLADNDSPSVTSASSSSRGLPSRRSMPRQVKAEAATKQRTAPATARRPTKIAAPSARVSRPTAAALAKATSTSPIVALLFNTTPTLSPTQSPPASDGVVRGSLNAGDPDGNALSYKVVRAPAYGQVDIDTAGRFTYTPAVAGQLAASDTFEVAVSDADGGFHMHGILGLVNLLTFGLIGTSGHTANRTVTVGIGPAVDPRAYVLAASPGVVVKAIQTVGDSPPGATYPMVGSPDGMGLFDNGDGTFTLLMNHELSSGSGAVHDHGATGAFISRWVIDKQTLGVISGSDLIQRVFSWNSATQSSDPSSSALALSRFCSGDLAAPSAYFHDGMGSTQQIYLTGEEGGSGRALATVATGPTAGDGYILGKFSPGTNGSGLPGTASWENLLANPLGQQKTVVIGNNDGGSGVMAGALAVYVGTKQNTGTEVDKAGLTNGVVRFVQVPGNPFEITDPVTRATGISSGSSFTLSDVASTSFSRPEDGAWNPANPNEYYFVTTDRLDQASDGVGSQVGRSRLWRLNFSDITNPELGGTIDLLIDGDTVAGGKVNMLDNMTIDRNGRILLQEDTGGAAHNAKIWRYDIASDTLTLVARHDPARFGDIGVPATRPFTINEESSGIIDAQDVLGPGWFLLTVMAHYPLGGALVEGGQLLALYDPVPA